MKFSNSGLFFLSSFFIYSCSNSNENTLQKSKNLEDINSEVILDSMELSKYFETSKVQIDTIRNNIYVTIYNSSLLLNKKKKMGNKWENSEPWVSVAATFQVKAINPNFDSLIYNIIIEGIQEHYSYSVKQFKLANNYLSVCWTFVKCLNNNDYLNIKKLLSSEITEKYGDTQITNFIRSTFNNNPIARTELLGTKIIGSKYSFYINFWDTANNAQTYTFSFLEGSDKIAGLQIVK